MIGKKTQLTPKESVLCPAAIHVGKKGERKEPDFCSPVNFRFPIKTDYWSIGLVLPQKNASAGNVFLITGVLGSVLSTSYPPCRGSLTKTTLSKSYRVGSEYCRSKKGFAGMI